MKISGYILTKNGKTGFLQTAIKSLNKTCEHVYVCDNGSTDETYKWLQKQDNIHTKQDTRNYKKHGNQIRQDIFNTIIDEQKPDFIIAIDDDEHIINPENTRKTLKNFLNKSVDTIGVNMLHMWNQEHYRTDGTWFNRITRPIIYHNRKNTEERWTDSGGAHSSRVPIGKVVATKIPVLHYGWMYKKHENRIQKMEAKKQRDKKQAGEQNKLLDLQLKHYNSVYEEPELEEIPDEWKEKVPDKFKDKHQVHQGRQT